MNRVKPKNSSILFNDEMVRMNDAEEKCQHEQAKRLSNVV